MQSITTPGTSNAYIYPDGGYGGNSYVPYTATTLTTPSGSAINDMETSATITKIAAALLKAQRKMGNASKDAKNPFFKSSYADLNSVREACIPVLNEEGISVLQPTVVINGKTYVRTLLLHESGEFMSSDTEVVCSKQNDPQAHGSGISYSRRYGLQSFLNIGTADDDGEGAMGRSKPATKAPEAVKAEPTKTPTPAATFRRPGTTTKTPEPTVVDTSESVEGWS